MIGLAKQWRKWSLAVLAIYLVGFLPLWLGGGYVLTESGRVRMLFGISTIIASPDVAEWQPLIGHFQSSYHHIGGEVAPRCDLIGWLYFPLLWVVQWQHPPVQLLGDKGEIIEAPTFPKGFSLHPRRSEELRSVLPRNAPK